MGSWSFRLVVVDSWGHLDSLEVDITVLDRHRLAVQVVRTPLVAGVGTGSVGSPVAAEVAYVAGSRPFYLNVYNFFIANEG